MVILQLTVTSYTAAATDYLRPKPVVEYLVEGIDVTSVWGRVHASQPYSKTDTHTAL